MTLEQLAREVGVLAKDHTTPCTSTVASGGADDSSGGACVVKILGTDINTASFAMYTYAISVAFQALLIVSMSGAVDHGAYRKKLLLAFSALGSVSTFAFIVVQPATFLLGGLLAIVCSTCFGACYVLMNSFLPLLVRRHPSIPQDPEPDLPQFDDERDRSGLADSTSALLAPHAALAASAKKAPREAFSRELQLSARISTYGAGTGYIGAFVVQAIGLIILFTMNSSLLSLKIVLAFIGLWWGLFSIPAALYLRPRPGPPLLAAQQPGASWTVYVTYSWKLLGRTVMQARQLRDATLFLLAWFMLSDALATVSSTAILFAKTDLQMAPPSLAFISVLATIFGVIGAFAWSSVTRWLNLSPMQIIAGIVILFELVPIYGLLGFIPAIRELGMFGLQNDWEMYIVGAYFGLILGSVGAYTRSLFGELIPPGSEAAFYSLYSITDKGSSMVGPTITGAIIDAYGSIRPAFVFLVVLVSLPLPLLALVNVQRGKEAAQRLAAREHGLDEPAVARGVYAPVAQAE